MPKKVAAAASLEIGGAPLVIDGLRVHILKLYACGAGGCAYSVDVDGRGPAVLKQLFTASAAKYANEVAMQRLAASVGVAPAIWGADAARRMIVMAVAPGGSFVRSKEPLRAAAQAAIFNAFAALDAAGMYFADMNSENVFIDDAGRVTIIDYGWAELHSSKDAARTSTRALLTMTTSAGKGRFVPELYNYLLRYYDGPAIARDVQRRMLDTQTNIILADPRLRVEPSAEFLALVGAPGAAAHSPIPLPKYLQYKLAAQAAQTAAQPVALAKEVQPAAAAPPANGAKAKRAPRAKPAPKAAAAPKAPRRARSKRAAAPRESRADSTLAGEALSAHRKKRGVDAPSAEDAPQGAAAEDVARDADEAAGAELRDLFMLEEPSLTWRMRRSVMREYRITRNRYVHIRRDTAARDGVPSDSMTVLLRGDEAEEGHRIHVVARGRPNRDWDAQLAQYITSPEAATALARARAVREADEAAGAPLSTLFREAVPTGLRMRRSVIDGYHVRPNPRILIQAQELAPAGRGARLLVRAYVREGLISEPVEVCTVRGRSLLDPYWDARLAVFARSAEVRAATRQGAGARRARSHGDPKVPVSPARSAGSSRSWLSRVSDTASALARGAAGLIRRGIAAVMTPRAAARRVPAGAYSPRKSNGDFKTTVVLAQHRARTARMQRRAAQSNAV